MAQVTVTYDGGTAVIPAEKGESLLSALRRGKFAVSAPCGGGGRCGKCRVAAAGALSEPEENERALLAGAGEGVRLACAARIEGDVQVTLGREAAYSGGALRRVRPGEPLGLALDIGTTTVEARFYALETGELLDERRAQNAQRAFGADVISRIAAAKEHLNDLQTAVADTISELIGQFCLSSGADTAQLVKAAAAGNTTMLHLLCGRDPSALGKAPFVPDTLFGASLPAEKCGLKLKNAQVYLTKCVSGFVGGDLAACAAAVGLDEGDAPRLLIDVGTNGEMALSAGGKIYVCSVAAGPALEGGRISCGMGGVPGAVRRARLINGEIALETIGDAPPEGVCGSGLIDLAALLLECGAIDETGRLSDEALLGRLKARITEENGEAAFRIDGAGVFFLTQRDIRELQLAKAAFAAGIGLLLEEAGGIEPVEVLLAGSMGSALDVDAARRIGLIPGCVKNAVVRAVGNGALEGASMVLFDGEMPARLAAFSGRAQVVELAGRAEFNERFVEEMLFPAPPPGLAFR